MIFKKLKSKLMVNVNHFNALCRRYISLIVSDKLSFLTLLFQAPIMLVVIYLACKKTFGYFDAQTTMFVISVICVVMATLNSYREICKERDILIRETNAGLDSTAYVLSKVFIQSLICLFQSLIIVVGTSFIIKFNITRVIDYINYYFFTFLILITSTCIGLLISALLKNSDSAILPVLFIIIAQLVLSGAIIDLPENLEFLSCIAVTRWALSGYSNIFKFKTLLPPKAKLKFIYETSYFTSCFTLILICIICITLTVVAVRHLRKKKY